MRHRLSRDERYELYAAEEEERQENQRRPLRLTRGEQAGAVLAAVILLYGLWMRDLPVVFLSAAFLLFVLRPLAEKLGKDRGQMFSNALQGFSVALFIGAVLLLIF